jgi:hypothetical protein
VTVVGSSAPSKKRGWAEAQPKAKEDERARKRRKGNSEGSLLEERSMGRERKSKKEKGCKGRRGRNEEGEGEGEGEGGGEGREEEKREE